MKSQINTDIFLETGCIKRDLLLNYRDDNLSDTQKHEVEEHLIDCPLCADALEGLMLVTGTAALDDIHSKVGSITEKPAGAGSFSYWAIAASITAVMLLSVFTYMQFKNANEPELAVAEKSISEEVVAEPTLPAIASDQAVPDNQDAVSKQLQANSQNTEQAAVVSKVHAPKILVAESDVNKDFESVAGNAVEEKMEEVSVLANEKESTKSAIVVQDASVTADHTAPAVFNLGSSYEIEKLDKTVSNVSHGSYMPAQVITYIDNVKVIDYHLNFFKQSSKSEPAKSTPSKFENRSKKSVAEAEEAKSGDEVNRKTSYLNLLTDPIVLFNKGRYESSLEQFSQILKINPGDQNASFYSGLCHFHLKDYSKALKLLKPIAANSLSPFYEEAEFYKARTLIASGKIDEGKQLLEQIVNKKGFYANQAADELTKIKP
jgi:hypothetical protein